MAGLRWARAWSEARLGVWIAVSRVAVGLVFGHLVVVLFHASMLHTRLGTLGDGTWLGAFDRWDARYYTAIAAHGYPSGAVDTTAFFPGYPLVVRAVHLAGGGILTYSQAGSVASCAAFVAAAGLLHRLVVRRFGARAGFVSTALFCWFPASCFFLAPYSEALFSLEILAVATLVERGRWWPAAAVAGFATATSPEAVALTVALVVAGLFGRRGWRRVLGYGLAGSWGLATYMAFLGIRFGDPLSFAHVVSRWHRAVGLPFVAVIQNVGSIRHALHEAGQLGPTSASVVGEVAWVWILDDLVMIAAAGAVAYLVATTIARIRREGWPDRHEACGPPGPETSGSARPWVPVLWTAVLAGIVAIASTTSVRAPGTPVSTEADARLVSAAFPLYPALFLMVRRWQVPIVLGLSGSVAAALLFQSLFNLGYWMT